MVIFETQFTNMFFSSSLKQIAVQFIAVKSKSLQEKVQVQVCVQFSAVPYLIATKTLDSRYSDRFLILDSPVLAIKKKQYGSPLCVKKLWGDYGKIL